MAARRENWTYQFHDHSLSVRPSVRATPFYFFGTNRYGNIPTETRIARPLCNGRASCFSFWRERIANKNNTTRRSTIYEMLQENMDVYIAFMDSTTGTPRFIDG